MRYFISLAVIAGALLALIAFGFWISYPIWWKGLFGPQYEFLTNVLGNAIVSVVDIIVVGVVIQNLLSWRAENRWRFVRQRFAKRVLNEVNTVCMVVEKACMKTLVKNGIRERLPTKVQGALANNFSDVSSASLKQTLHDSLEKIENLIGLYSSALDVASFDFVARVVDKLEALGSTMTHTARWMDVTAADVDTVRTGILEPCKDVVAALSHVQSFAKEEIPRQLGSGEFTNFPRIHSNMIAVLLSDISANLKSLNSDPIPAPNFSKTFHQLL